MEEDQEMKHFCKFCDKSFPCGRSLGGHMRSHLISVPDESNEKLMKKKLPSLIKIGGGAGGGGGSSSGGGGLPMGSYGLREKPKKTTKFAISSEEFDSVESKVCKECGKGFASWKALFGHMKCHSEKVSQKAVLLDHDHKYHSMDSTSTDCQSENETAAPVRKKQRSRIKRYTKLAPPNTALTAHHANNNASSSQCGSEIENNIDEQEEVAFSLLLLSRNLRNSDESSVLKKSVFVDQFHSDESNSSKRKYSSLNDASNLELISKFECTTCNKSFHSYQALGGHRASHKKMKGCFGSKIDSSENSTETDIDSNLIMISKSSFCNESSPSIITKSHECPICFKAFSSGQALGGHKRSHLIAEAKTSQAAREQIQKVPQIRDFLDLNLPAPMEEEEEEQGDKVYFNRWWLMGSNLKQDQPLVGII